MRINKTISAALLLTFTFSFYSASAKTEQSKLSNFSPGIYKVKKGKMSECGEGRFTISEEKTFLKLGALHNFSIEKNEAVNPSDIPGEENCKTKSLNDVKQDGGKTRLMLSSTYTCDGKLKYSLIKTAVLKKNKVNMAVVRTGTDPYKYKCKWSLRKQL